MYDHIDHPRAQFRDVNAMGGDPAVEDGNRFPARPSTARRRLSWDDLIDSWDDEGETLPDDRDFCFERDDFE